VTALVVLVVFADFSLSQWMADSGISDLANLTGDVLSNLYSDLNIDMYLNKKQCQIQQKDVIAGK